MANTVSTAIWRYRSEKAPNAKITMSGNNAEVRMGPQIT
jgi:hypothetical protein